MNYYFIAYDDTGRGSIDISRCQKFSYESCVETLLEASPFKIFGKAKGISEYDSSGKFLQFTSKRDVIRILKLKQL